MLTWLCTCRIGFGKELLEEDGMFIVVPITDSDGILLIILVGLVCILDDEWSSKAINVLAAVGRKYDLSSASSAEHPH